MSQLLEMEVRAALAERAREIPEHAAERLRRIDYRPRARALGPRAAVGAGAGLAATCGVTVALVGLGVGAAPAFAGWSATPTQPTSGETAGALAQCQSRLAGAGGGSGLPVSGWQPVLTDTRGPFTAMVLQSGSATATCLNGPSFTTTAANSSATNTAGGGSQHVMSVSSPNAAGGGSPAVSLFALGGPTSPISEATALQFTTSAGQPYTIVQGQVEAGATAVTLGLSDGTDVQATVADGTFIAWWPGSASATSARVTDPAGATTQELAFTPASPEGGGSRVARSSSQHTQHVRVNSLNGH
jgi:hypothetical protein